MFQEGPTRVKIFTVYGGRHDKLEEQINSWLMKNHTYTIKSITPTQSGTGNEHIYAVMVHYLEYMTKDH